MTKELLNKIINNLYDVGYHVVAISSDMGPTNMGLWRNLGISMDITSFEHLITKNNIYVFADPPHIFKLARNHLLDK